MTACAVGRDPFIAQELGATTPIGQTFRMPSDGLYAVDLQFSTDRPTSLLL